MRESKNTRKTESGNTESSTRNHLLEHESTWEAFQQALQKVVKAETYRRWFLEARPVSHSESECLIALPTETHLLWVETNYFSEIKNAAQEVFGGLCKVTLTVSEPIKDDTQTEKTTPSSNPRPQISEKQSLAEIEISEAKLNRIGLNRSYSFDRFVVGENNQFAQAACSAVAQKPSTIYNPLFIHGGSGLGKTHLMHAVGRKFLESKPRGKVLYYTCEKFTNEFISALRTGTIDAFRNSYRNADLVLIDDVQFLAGKNKSREEFFHTFNTLLDSHTQVILTSDCPASEIQTLEPRLMTRFECGLTVALQPPELETRIAILCKKQEEWETKLPEEIIRFIAEHISSNVRRLEGALTQLVTYSSLTGGKLTVEQAANLLADILREESSKQITVDEIQKLIVEKFDLRLADMINRRRPASIAHPRQIAMYLSRKFTRLSLVEVGNAFGGRDHGTVIHACKKIESEIIANPKLRQKIEHFGELLSR